MHCVVHGCVWYVLCMGVYGTCCAWVCGVCVVHGCVWYVLCMGVCGTCCAWVCVVRVVHVCCVHIWCAHVLHCMMVPYVHGVLLLEYADGCRMMMICVLA